LTDIRHIDKDVVGGMTVQGCTQTLLIEVVTDETDAATKNEETIQSADFYVLVSFLWSESAAVS